jgi:DNA-binding beta-propeller fold protein YncE
MAGKQFQQQPGSLCMNNRSGTSVKRVSFTSSMFSGDGSGCNSSPQRKISGLARAVSVAVTAFAGVAAPTAVMAWDPAAHADCGLADIEVASQSVAGKAGQVYALGEKLGEIYHIDLTTSPATINLLTSGLNTPTGIVVSPLTPNLFVADKSNYGSMIKVDLNSGSQQIMCQEIGSAGKIAWQTDELIDYTEALSGSLKYTGLDGTPPYGCQIRTFGEGFELPYDIAVGNRFLVSDYLPAPDGGVNVYRASDKTLLHQIGKGVVDMPSAVYAVWAPVNQDIWVASFNTGKLHRFNYSDTSATLQAELQGFQEPMSMIYDNSVAPAASHLLVAEYSTGNIVRVNVSTGVKTIVAGVCSMSPTDPDE